MNLLLAVNVQMHYHWCFGDDAMRYVRPHDGKAPSLLSYDSSHGGSEPPPFNMRSVAETKAVCSECSCSPSNPKSMVFTPHDC